jgi:Xaa-Pro aminopeptidase
MISDFRYTHQLQQECPGLELEIRPVQTTFWPFVGGVLARTGLREVGFESDALSVSARDQLQTETPPDFAIIPVSGLVEELRAIKDACEVMAIRQAIGVAERAFLKNLLHLRDETCTEKQFADLMDASMRSEGALCASFPVIAASGAHAALPHARPRPKQRIGNSGMVLVDWGADVGPYKSDMTRTMWLGEPEDLFERIYQTVLTAHDRAISAVRPGTLARSVDEAARACIERAGYGSSFGHGTGHGVGRMIHESPWLRVGNTATLQAGMVVTIEPGIYLPGWGGVRIEDVILVTEAGAEVLTTLPTSLEWSRAGWR